MSSKMRNDDDICINKVKYPIFIEASKYTICPKNKDIFISCANGSFPYGIQYKKNKFYWNKNKIKLEKEPDRLCMQLLDLFDNIIMKKEENNLERMTYEYSLHLMKKNKWNDDKRKNFYSFVMIGILLRIINKNTMEIERGKIKSISSIIFNNDEYELDFDNYQVGSSITSNVSK